MRIFLVQHGEAVDKSIDPERPLSGKGEKVVKSVAAILADAGAAPETIVHSGKTRAKQTAEILGRVLGVDVGARGISGIAPLDSVTDFAQRLPQMVEETMVCGHQPFMGKLVSHLLAGDEAVPLVEYSPGSVACLERSAEGNWVLCWFLRPELCGSND